MMKLNTSESDAVINKDIADQPSWQAIDQQVMQTPGLEKVHMGLTETSSFNELVAKSDDSRHRNEQS